jgi:hypothetical protein
MLPMAPMESRLRRKENAPELRSTDDEPQPLLDIVPAGPDLFEAPSAYAAEQGVQVAGLVLPPGPIPDEELLEELLLDELSFIAGLCASPSAHGTGQALSAAESALAWSYDMVFS